MPIQGVRPRDCPRKRISRPQFSARSCQRGFVFSIKAIFFSRRQRLICFSRPMATSTSLVAFVIHQAMALVFLGEALDGVVFMLKNATREKTGDTRVQRAGAAGENVDPELVLESIAHPAKDSRSRL